MGEWFEQTRCGWAGQGWEGDANGLIWLVMRWWGCGADPAVLEHKQARRVKKEAGRQAKHITARSPRRGHRCNAYQCMRNKQRTVGRTALVHWSAVACGGVPLVAAAPR